MNQDPSQKFRNRSSLQNLTLNNQTTETKEKKMVDRNSSLHDMNSLISMYSLSQDSKSNADDTAFPTFLSPENQNRAEDEYYASVAKLNRGTFSSKNISGSARTNLDQGSPAGSSTKTRNRKLGRNYATKAALNGKFNEITQNNTMVISNLSRSYSVESNCDESQLSPTNSSSTGTSQLYSITLSEGDIEFSLPSSTQSSTDDHSVLFNNI